MHDAAGEPPNDANGEASGTRRATKEETTPHQRMHTRACTEPTSTHPSPAHLDNESTSLTPFCTVLVSTLATRREDMLPGYILPPLASWRH